jgi:hypothetical protein
MSIITKQAISPAGKLNVEDLKRWGKNALIFLAPVIIIFLTAVKGGADVKDALYLVYLWGLNVVIDLLRKLADGK